MLSTATVLNDRRILLPVHAQPGDWFSVILRDRKGRPRSATDLYRTITPTFVTLSLQISSNRYTPFTRLPISLEKLRIKEVRMKIRRYTSYTVLAFVVLFLVCVKSAMSLPPTVVTFLPYIEPGDNGPFGPKDQMVVTWQTNEVSPVTSAYFVEFGKSLPSSQTAVVNARVVDNYLAADPQFSSLVLPFQYGAHSNYTAVLRDLEYDTTYSYQVTGPGLPVGGFVSSFHTRKTGLHFQFQVQGDEGYYPGIPGTSPPVVANYEARIINTMFNVGTLSLPGRPRLSSPDFALNTGDNIYIAGADSNYRDMWMRDWNNDVSSNETGAPFIRSVPLYVVAGNHDVGSTGATANLLADSGTTIPGSSGPGPFGGGVGGGDALAYFNNFYYPLNGPAGVDIQSQFHVDASSPTNFFFSFNGTNYTSPAAIEGLRASTQVDSGKGPKRQIDHMGNYSFDYGNAHFLFLDANPHLFDNLLPNGPPGTLPDFPFPDYPTVLKNWIINDLDASHQTWKIAVFHQPSFSSGNATISNDQMRTIAHFLEDHGVNMVFNGHEHNYQRSLPIRALANLPAQPSTGVPQVAVDAKFDGISHTVPDGVLYFVEGAGGNRDFDDNLLNPRGGGASIDQDDAATGTVSSTINGMAYSFVQGVASFLDTSLTDDAMKVFLGNPGSGPKITARFKSKVFSFAHIKVDDNIMTLYQISEPLLSTSSATPSNPAPFGTDYRGIPLNDPIPDTVFDPVTRAVVSQPATGTPALLDKVSVLKPDISKDVKVKFDAPAQVTPGGQITFSFAFKNGSAYALNGTQVVVTLPAGALFDSVSDGSATVQGQDIVVTLGRTVPGNTVTIFLKADVSGSVVSGSKLTSSALLRSSTALPVVAGIETTKVKRDDDNDDDQGQEHNR
jgi:uncharacterized repeat protein (TIGR01451 family)